MKKLILVATFIITITSISAQKVYSVDSEYDADVKIYVVNSKYDADLLVYKVNSEYDAGNNNGKWFFVNSEYDAKKKVFFVNSEYDADLKIYFVDSEYDAVWENNSKKYLNYLNCNDLLYEKYLNRSFDNSSEKDFDKFIQYNNLAGYVATRLDTVELSKKEDRETTKSFILDKNNQSPDLEDICKEYEAYCY